MIRISVFLLFTSWLLVAPGFAAPNYPSVRVADTHVDIHSGPGRGFPVFYSAQRDDWVDVLKRRSEWFKVRTPRGVEGWIHQEQLEHTQTSRGEPVVITEASVATYSQRRWEMGYLAGQFGGGNLLSMYGSWYLNENLSTEIQFGEISSSFADTRYGTFNLVHQPWSAWRYSPFISVGWGKANIEPLTVLVQAQNAQRQESVLAAGVGLRTYLSKRFLLRAEYKHYTILTNRNDNQEIDEWKAGFAVFF